MKKELHHKYFRKKAILQNTYESQQQLRFTLTTALTKQVQ